MKNSLFVILLFFSFFSFGGTEKSENDRFLELLPKDFIDLYKKREAPGDPDFLSMHGEKYYIRDGLKYAVKLTERNGKVTGIHFTCTKSTQCSSIENFKKFMTSSNIQESKNSKDYPGRFVELSFPHKKIVLRFQTNSTYDLHEIIYDSTSEKEEIK